MEVTDRIDILYFTDPLCCWSWAMEPQWRKLVFQYKDYITRTYCMGGLIPSWNGFVDNINSVSRAPQMGPLWMHAEQISGMPTGSTIWVHNAPTSSFPSCIAVKCATAQSAELGERMLRKLREFCHLDNRNISDKAVIHEAAKELALETSSFELAKFVTDFDGAAGRDYFRKDWEETRRLSITRFPTLLLTKANVGTIQLSGYRSFAIMQSALFQLDPTLQKVESDFNLARYKRYWGSLVEREELEFVNERQSQPLDMN